MKLEDLKSTSFSWSKDDTKKVIRAGAFAMLSAIIAGLVTVFQSGDSLPDWVLPLVPLVNIFLYGVSRWVADNR